MNKVVAFIILNYKTFEDTITLGKEILNLRIPDSVIIIVDNCSPNDSYCQLINAFSSTPFVDIIQAKVNGGYAKGNNIGLRYAKKYSPEYVCIINNDVHFSREIIPQLIYDLEHNGQVGAIAPIQFLPDGRQAPFISLNLHSFKDDLLSYLRVYHPPKIEYKATEADGRLMKVGIIPGAFIFMRYSTAERVGFFDECTFLYCEERFLSKKLEKELLGCFIDTKISYIHAHSKTISSEKSYLQQQKLILKSRRLFVEKYCPNGRAKSFILMGVGSVVIRIRSIIKRLNIK